MILGRDPALWAAAARALILLVTTFFFPLTIDQQGTLNALVAVIIGLVVAFQVAAEKAVPFILGLLEAGTAVAVSFGWNMSPDRQLVIMTVAAALVGLFTRDRVVAPIDAAGNRVPPLR